MKVCPHCGEHYAEFVDFCFVDGSVLALNRVASVADEPDVFDAPPPPKMLQGSQQRATYTRSATPVPRARRPNRSLIASGAGAEYSPPDVEAPASSPPVPESMPYGDEPDLVSDEPDSNPQGPSGGWGADQADDFGAAPPTPIAPGHVEISRADHAAIDIQDEDEDRKPGVGLWALAGMGFVAVVGVGLVGMFTVGTFLVNPDDSGTATAPPPIPVQPVAPPPVPKPFVAPAVPPPPEPTDSVVPEPTLVEPEPVPPIPITPEPPIVPEPARPVPVRPNPVPRPSVAMVSVGFVSVPSSARLSIDGQAVATTPFNHRLRAGMHRVVISKDGFETYTKRVDFRDDMELRVSLTPTGGVVPEPVAPPPAPVEAAAPEPVDEPVRTMVFAQPAQGVETLSVVQSGTRIRVPGTINYPPNGGTVVFEMTNAAGNVWKSAVKCGPIQPMAGVNRLVVANSCGPLKTTP